MSKTITIPSDKGSRVIVTVNNKEYVYKAGVTATVPDEVAALFEANAYYSASPRRGVAPLNPKDYGEDKDGVHIVTDSEGNMYAPVRVEGHTLIIGEE